MTVLSLFVYSLEQWSEVKITFLKRLIVTAHARHLSPTGTSKYGLHVVYLYRFICALDVMTFVVKCREQNNAGKDDNLEAAYSNFLIACDMIE